jgi:molecular chaperone GrpE
LWGKSWKTSNNPFKTFVWESGDWELGEREINLEKKKHTPKAPAQEDSVEVKSEEKTAVKPPEEARAAEEKKEMGPLSRIQAQLEEKTRESSEYFDKWLRLRAEMENFKKRMEKEKSEHLKFGNESLLKALLPILDNLERAIDHGKNARENSPLMVGVEMIRKELASLLEKFGVKPIPAAGEAFDPEKHEAISQQESDLEANRVVSAVQNGYFYHDRLLRPAKVIVSGGRPGEKKETPE